MASTRLHMDIKSPKKMEHDGCFIGIATPYLAGLTSVAGTIRRWRQMDGKWLNYKDLTVM